MATTVGDFERTLQKQQELIDGLLLENKILREQLDILKKGLFGRKSEHLDPNQLALFGDEDVESIEGVGDAPAPEPQQNKTKGHGRASFGPQVPRETITLDLDETDRCCPDCGQALRPIGEDVCERGHIVPSRVVVRRYVRKKYACPNGHTVRTPEAPAALIERCKYEPSVYAHIATAKYCDHLPLNRLAGIFKRHGVHLPKQTMWDMLVRVDELVAQPVLRQMRQELLQSPILHADETPITMRLEDQKGTRNAYAWDWQSRDGKRILDFTLTRERDGPVKFLDDWSGTLLTDGYSGYDKVVAQNNILRAGCWAHARRKLKDALDTGSRSAARVLVHVQRLFRLERAINKRMKARGLDPESVVSLRADVRRRRSRRVINRIFSVADDLAAERQTLPRGALGKALTYLENQREPLIRFLDDPELPIHNNDAERDLRHLVVGRKNWMVFGSPRGGEVACRLYSLVLSCKAVGVDPEAYLTDVLEAVGTVSGSELPSLTPWGWAKARAASTEAATTPD